MSTLDILQMAASSFKYSLKQEFDIMGINTFFSMQYGWFLYFSRSSAIGGNTGTISSTFVFPLFLLI